MSGRWHRLGVLPLDVSAAHGWARTHAALPVVETTGDGTWDVYLSLRDAAGRARIGRTRLTLAPRPVLAPLEREPVLDIGGLGTFDDNGVVTSCLVRDGDRRLLFYTGWTRGYTVPFYLAAGVAISEAGGAFLRSSRAPVLDRSPDDPFLTASPFVLHDGGVWRMWYVSGTGWLAAHRDPEPCYHVRYAESHDGVHWQRSGLICLDYGPGEHAFGRPWVLRDGDRYRMWFPVRGERYRIGYAESSDGLVWERLDGVGGLLPAGDGWESQMVEYPCVFDHAGRRYMLYNGNQYGGTGVGLAVWDATAPGEGG